MDVYYGDDFGASDFALGDDYAESGYGDGYGGGADDFGTGEFDYSAYADFGYSIPLYNIY